MMQKRFFVVCELCGTLDRREAERGAANLGYGFVVAEAGGEAAAPEPVNINVAIGTVVIDMTTLEERRAA